MKTGNDKLKRYQAVLYLLMREIVFLFSKEFAGVVQKSDNYFVIATREKLPMLPYSVNEIYGFRKSGKFHEAKQKYNEIYHIYGELTEEGNVDPEYVITEDSNSGYVFFFRIVES
mgnify:CR=1 FL=1